MAGLTYANQDGPTGTFTTANGMVCEDIYAHAGGTVDAFHRLRAIIPSTVDPAFPAAMVWYLHGVSGDEDSMVTDADMGDMLDAWLDRGWVVIGPDSGGATWGNSSAMSGLEDVWTWADAIWTVAKSGPLVYGQSMGGLVGLNLIHASTVPVVAYVGNSAAIDLEAVYNGAVALQSSIENAYSFSSPYDAGATTGFDPMDALVADYSGVPMRFYASSGDSTISKTNNADAFETKMAAHDAELTVISVSGGHVSTDHYRPADTIAFYDRALIDNVPTSGATAGSW